MKKISIISLCLCCLAITAFAQKDRSKEIVEKFTNAMNSYNSIACDFTVVVNNNQLKTKEQYEGKVLAQKEKYVLTLDDYIIHTDGVTKWVYLKNENEVNIILNDPESVDIIENPILFLSSQPKNIRYVQKESITENGKQLTVIEYFPKESKTVSWAYIRLSLDEKDMKPYILFYHGKDGVDYTITLKNFTTNVKTSPADFTFIPSNHPDIIVVDLRGGK